MQANTQTQTHPYGHADWEPDLEYLLRNQYQNRQLDNLTWQTYPRRQHAAASRAGHSHSYLSSITVHSPSVTASPLTPHTTPHSTRRPRQPTGARRLRDRTLHAVHRLHQSETAKEVQRPTADRPPADPSAPERAQRGGGGGGGGRPQGEGVEQNGEWTLINRNVKCPISRFLSCRFYKFWYLQSTSFSL